MTHDSSVPGQGRELPPPSESAVPESSRQAPRVIFILGWGRSGSTLLANILGELQGCVSVGELHDLWSSYASRFECGCGQSLTQCPFWDRAALADPAVARALRSASAVHRTKRRYVRVRFVPGMLYDALSTHAFRTSLDAYSDLIVHLYRALASAAQAEVIIDSGKSPAAAAQLLRTPLELSVIHLVRDPRATGFSWQRVRDADQRGARQQTRISYVSNAASWLAWNAAAEMIRGRVDPRDWFRMRYEDFVAAPELVLGQIVAAFGLSTAGWPIHGREARLGTHHTVEGNPSRFKTGSVLIQGDDEWMRKMSAGARVVSVALTAPLFVAYGYHKRLAPAGTPGISLQH